MREFTDTYFIELGKIVVGFGRLESLLRSFWMMLETKGRLQLDDLDSELGKQFVGTLRKKIVKRFIAKIKSFPPEGQQESWQAFKPTMRRIEKAIIRRNDIIHSTWGWGPKRKANPDYRNAIIYRERVLNEAGDPVKRQSAKAGVRELKIIVRQIEQADESLRTLMGIFTAFANYPSRS